MAQFLKESTVDGEDYYYLVESDEAASLLRDALDLELGTLVGVDYWEGWDKDGDPFVDLNIVDQAPLWNEFLAMILADGNEIATVDEIKLYLDDESDKPGTSFSVNILDYINKEN